MLLNIFHVNAAHNVVHLLTGVVALLAGMAGVGGGEDILQNLRLRLWTGRSPWFCRGRRITAGRDLQQHG